LSEEFPSNVVPPEEETAEQPVSVSETVEPKERRGLAGWIAPAWFLFGIIVGIAAFAAYNALVIKPAAPSVPVAAAQIESIDSTEAMRAAARDGTLDAIATMQAGGGPQQPAAQEPQGPQQVASNAFVVRESAREGDPNAKVTIYEFSDFQ
jgi:hypothetical protein